jgi:nucleotide-binding universal stress UspA family protein
MKIQRIVVPLDGSKLAECALDYAEAIAQGCQTKEVILVSVTESVTGQTASPESQELFRASDRSDVSGVYPGSGQITTTFPVVPTLVSPPNIPKSTAGAKVTLGKKEKQAERYLGKVGKTLAAKGIPTSIQVLIGNPAEEIANYVKNSDIDMIVMSSHGRSGPSRWAYGSVADKIFRASCVPVLMVKAPGCIIGI